MGVLAAQNRYIRVNPCGVPYWAALYRREVRLFIDGRPISEWAHLEFCTFQGMRAYKRTNLFG